MPAPSERLPWLNDEPPSRAVTAAQRAPAGSMWPWYLLLLLLVAAVAAGAWWLSTGKDAAPPVLPAEESLPIPVAEAPPAEALPTAPANNRIEAPAGEPQPSLTRFQPDRFARVAERPAERQAPSTEGESSSGRGIFPADEPATALPVTGPAPVIVYNPNPNPNRGRVVQLGAFPTRAQAEENWKRITRRYPYLATKPKMVNTVDVRGLGGGRPTRMYRLQLGTSSQAQSVVICQQLDRAGHSCVVVY